MDMFKVMIGHNCACVFCFICQFPNFRIKPGLKNECYWRSDLKMLQSFQLPPLGLRKLRMKRIWFSSIQQDLLHLFSVLINDFKQQKASLVSSSLEGGVSLKDTEQGGIWVSGTRSQQDWKAGRALSASVSMTPSCICASWFSRIFSPSSDSGQMLTCYRSTQTDLSCLNHNSKFPGQENIGSIYFSFLYLMLSALVGVAKITSVTALKWKCP